MICPASVEVAPATCLVRIHRPERPSEDVASYQYVMNTETGAWTKFTGWTAFCFETARDTLYFGSNGYTAKADTGYDDNESPITCDARQAFNYFGNRGRLKHIKLMQPVLEVNSDYGIRITADVDYTTRTVASLANKTAGGGDPWGGIWDVTWIGSAVAQSLWYSVPVAGVAVAPRIKVRTLEGYVSWSATNVLFELGGLVG